jgi:signal transduction histidine kinase
VPSEFPRFSAEVETAIFKITQEALTNVFRHASAKKAVVKLQELDGEVQVLISDDGKGISKGLETSELGTFGIGLIGIKQRVEEHGGHLSMKNGSPGTIVSVRFPLQVKKNIPTPMVL